MQNRWKVCFLITISLVMGLVIGSWLLTGLEADKKPSEPVVQTVTTIITNVVLVTNIVSGEIKITDTNTTTPVVAVKFNTNNTLVLNFEDFKLGYGNGSSKTR